MQLTGWVRARLWRAVDWRAALAELAATASSDHALELARAAELVEPDRAKALAHYVTAWRSGVPDVLERVRALATELHAHDPLAELALADHETSKDPVHLVAAGAAWIDAGKLGQALEPLARATQERPRDLDAKALLAIARRELRDPHAEVSRCNARAAQAARGELAAIYLHAARVARASARDDLYASVLASAVKRCPDDQLVALVEQRLLARGHADALLEHYRTRFELAKDEREWVTRVQAAALLLRGVHPGLGLRLLRTSLEHAYAAKLADIPGHIAAWGVLAEHARGAKTMRELLPLVVDALKLPLPDDERLYVALVGFEIAQVDAPDDVRTYASTIGELAPRHPAIRAVIIELADELADADVEEVAPPTQPAMVVRLSQPLPVIPTSGPVPVIPAAALAALRAKPPAIPAIPPLPANAIDRAARAVVPIDVDVTAAGEKFSAVARDLSTSGVFLVTARPLARGEVVTLQLNLPGANPLAQVRYGISAKVARETPAGYGLAFVAPSPEAIAAIARITETR